MIPSTPPQGGNPRALSLLGVALALTVPALLLRLFQFDPHRAPLNGLLIYGMCVVASAFILTWAAEVAELEIGSGLAVVFLALVTVLPEYAVDIYLAWTAGHDPAYEHKALANMTGANQILIGTGWPVVALLVWYRTGSKGVALRSERSGDVVWLLLATLYSCVIPLKRSVCVYDALALFACYAIYVKTSSRDSGGEHDPGDLVGPPRVMAAWPRRRRRGWIVALFLWAAGAILAASEPFSESLIAAGTRLKIDDVLLIKWLAPLASEAPEFVVVVLLTMRGRGEMGLGAFISSKVNQWTLLVGGVPIAYSISKGVHGAGFTMCLPMDEHMTSELWLTAAQGLYAVAAIADLDFSLGQALTILGLFLAQFVTTVLIATGLLVIPALGDTPNHAVSAFHNTFAILYGLLAIERFVSQRTHLRARFADVFRRRPPAPPPDLGQRYTPDEMGA